MAKITRISGKVTITAAAMLFAIAFLAAAKADTPNRAGDVKQASRPIHFAAQQIGQAEEIEAIGPRNFGPVEPPPEIDFLPVELPQDQPAEELAHIFGHYYGGYGGYYRPYAYASFYRPYAYGYPYASYYRPYYAYPYHYSYFGYYVPNYTSRYVGYYSPYPYVGYYSPSPYVGYGYRPVFVAPPVYGGCYYW